MSENELEEAALAVDQEKIDLQNASSIRYAVDLSIALLPSGHWAVYHGGGPVGMQQIEIHKVLNVERLVELAYAENVRRAEPVKPWPKATAKALELKDLDL